MPRFLSAKPDARLITLPWETPLAEWPEERLVALPRGISRHVVRFVRVGKEVYAVKEVLEHLALHEYRLLRDLKRLDTPSVDPVGVAITMPSQPNSVTGRPSTSSTTSISRSRLAFSTAASFTAQKSAIFTPSTWTVTSSVIRSSTV